MSELLSTFIFHPGFVSHYTPHKEIYGIPEDLPTLHSKHGLICSLFIRVNMTRINSRRWQWFHCSRCANYRVAEDVQDVSAELPQRRFERHLFFLLSTELIGATGHSIPVRGTWPNVFRTFILNAVAKGSKGCARWDIGTTTVRRRTHLIWLPSDLVVL